jgi:hypothetical protein
MINYKDLELVDEPLLYNLVGATEELVKAMTHSTLPTNDELNTLQKEVCQEAMKAFFGEDIIKKLKLNALEHIMKAINDKV